MESRIVRARCSNCDCLLDDHELDQVGLWCPTHKKYCVKAV
jgi:hypothetical protein